MTYLVATGYNISYIAETESSSGRIEPELYSVQEQLESSRTSYNTLSSSV